MGWMTQILQLARRSRTLLFTDGNRCGCIDEILVADTHNNSIQMIDHTPDKVDGTACAPPLAPQPPFPGAWAWAPARC